MRPQQENADGRTADQEPTLITNSTPLYRKLFSLICLMCVLLPLSAQFDRQNSSLMNRFGGQTNGRRTAESDSIDDKTIPRGLTVWTIDDRFGAKHRAEPDTLQHLFQNSVFADLTGQLNSTGNLGAPSISRVWNGEGYSMFGSPFVFAQPYAFFVKDTRDLLFTNTKSPITNISYHSGGGMEEGDDRLKVVYATNVNKRLGLGFKLDYIYGRGFYQNQATSLFGGNLYGSYNGDHYELHAYYKRNHIKNTENGGLTDDVYITHPENFSTKYETREMPVRLSNVWNYTDVDGFFLTHRYNFGYYSLAPSPSQNGKDNSENAANDSTQVRVFVPVASIFHTFKWADNNRQFIDKGNNTNYFADNYIADSDATLDETTYQGVTNTFGIEMTEGFKPWVKTGMRLFGKHEYQRFTLPDETYHRVRYTENLMSLGAELYRGKGKYFGYDIVGEIRTTGQDWGEFNVEGDLHFDIPILKDTLHITTGGFVRNQRPSFYLRHYHSQHAWWDNDDLDKIFHSRLSGQFCYKATSLKVAIETIQNYAYLSEYSAVTADNAPASLGVRLNQSNKNVQILSATLKQGFKFGILNWENELTLQRSSDNDLIPLPTFTGWSNLFLKFCIAKVLNTEFGADVRYFTRYDAPAYSPIVGQYVVQDAQDRVKIGNYPWVNVYLNFHLKHARFYAMLSHVNALAEGGKYFLTPHYPSNQMVFRIGLSWNFFN